MAKTTEKTSESYGMEHFNLLLSDQLHCILKEYLLATEVLKYPE